MSILIKGMGMPQNCEECDVKAVCKNYWKLIRKQHTRPSWCPLTLVPPHGDLIDRDTAYEQFLNLMDVQGAINPCQLGTILVDAPTIIEAEDGET